jgi:hypothetical protein
MKKPRIGRHIENLGDVLTILIILAGVVYGIYLSYKGSVAMGIAVIVGGLIGGWLSTLLLRGYGRLVENSDRCAELLLYIADHMPEKAPPVPRTPEPPPAAPADQPPRAGTAD